MSVLDDLIVELETKLYEKHRECDELHTVLDYLRDKRDAVLPVGPDQDYEEAQATESDSVAQYSPEIVRVMEEQDAAQADAEADQSTDTQPTYIPSMSPDAPPDVGCVKAALIANDPASEGLTINELAEYSGVGRPAVTRIVGGPEWEEVTGQKRNRRYRLAGPLPAARLQVVSTDAELVEELRAQVNTVEETGSRLTEVVDSSGEDEVATGHEDTGETEGELTEDEVPEESYDILPDPPQGPVVFRTSD
jgi:hypothetical protein